MYFLYKKKNRNWIEVMVISVGIVLAAGCQTPEAKQTPARQPSPEEVARIPTEQNVVNVAAFYDPYSPWLWDKDRSKTRGIVVRALYLEGPHAKGVFGDGIIHPRLYVSEKKSDGNKQWVLTKEWSFDVEQAIPLRAKKETMMGWGYRLHLDWGDLNLANREIRMIIGFERRDGHVIHSDKKDFRVPSHGS